MVSKPTANIRLKRILFLLHASAVVNLKEKNKGTKKIKRVQFSERSHFMEP